MSLMVAAGEHSGQSGRAATETQRSLSMSPSKAMRDTACTNATSSHVGPGLALPRTRGARLERTDHRDEQRRGRRHRVRRVRCRAVLTTRGGDMQCL